MMRLHPIRRNWRGIAESAKIYKDSNDSSDSSRLDSSSFRITQVRRSSSVATIDFDKHDGCDHPEGLITSSQVIKRRLAHCPESKTQRDKITAPRSNPNSRFCKVVRTRCESMCIWRGTTDGFSVFNQTHLEARRVLSNRCIRCRSNRCSVCHR